MSDDELPRIVLPGSEDWWSGVDEGIDLEERFPSQDGYDFALAVHHNDPGPLSEWGVSGLLMLQQGANDGDEWVWLVRVSNGEHWVLTGWCDYTGWDCQSSGEWSRWSEVAPDEVCLLCNLRPPAPDGARLTWGDAEPRTCDLCADRIEARRSAW